MWDFYIHSNVYTDTFKNKSYTVSQREEIEVAAPLHESLPEGFIPEYMDLRKNDYRL